MFAHAGCFCWDEFVLVLTPLVVVTLLLTLARRRIRRHNQAAPDDEYD